METAKQRKFQRDYRELKFVCHNQSEKSALKQRYHKARRRHDKKVIETQLKESGLR